MTEDILRRIKELYDVTDLCDILDIDSDIFVDKFANMIYDNLDKFDVLTEMDWVGDNEGEEPKEY